MSFISRLKNRLCDRERMTRRELIVDRRDLSELIDHFERLDSVMRKSYDNGDLERDLANAAIAIYHKSNKEYGYIQLIISNALNPLIEEKIKRKDLDMIARAT